MDDEWKSAGRYVLGGIDMKIEEDRIIDISISLTPDMIVYPDDPQPKVYWKFSIDDGYPSNVGYIDAGLHHGTHVDAPFHFDSNRTTIEKVPFDRWIGKCLVVDLTHLTKCISRADLEKIEDMGDYERILFKTKNSLIYLKEKSFNYNFIYIEKGAADYIVAKGIKTVGLDYITVDKYGSDLDAHKAFLLNGVTIIEAINLEHVTGGKYTLFCMPLKIPNMDAAPARAFLYK